MAVKAIRILFCAASLPLFLTACQAPVPMTETIETVFEQIHTATEKLVAENEDFSMFLDETTAGLKVVSKKNGTVWAANPSKEVIGDGVTPETKGKLLSQLSITFADENDKTSTMNSYVDAVEKGQYTIRYGQKDVTVTYVMGKVEKQSLLPVGISADDMESLLLSRFTNESDKQTIRSLYRLYSYDTAAQNKRESLLVKFPAFRNIDVYERNPDMAEYLLEDAETLLKASGFSLDDLNRIHQNIGYEAAKKPQKLFEISVTYALEEDGVRVTIPSDGIRYDRTVYTLTDIQLLEYFSAARQDESGYLFFPEGCGGIIPFVRSDTTAFPYSRSIYGDDIGQDFVKQDAESRVMLPVFGVAKETGSFLAVVENSDAAAYLTADVAGRISPYANIFAGFRYTSLDSYRLDMQKNKSMNLYAPASLNADMEVRYILLDGMADYSKMAKVYREELLDTYDIKDADRREDTQLNIRLLGGVQRTRSVLGIPSKYTQSLTTFPQAVHIAEELAELKAGKIHFYYEGWQPGGLSSSCLYKDAVDDKIAGGMTADELQKEMERYHATLNFSYAVTNTRNQLFDSFHPDQDAVKDISGRIYEHQEPDLAFQDVTEDTPVTYYTNLSAQKKMLERLVNTTASGVCLQDAGSVLFSDFSQNQYRDRQTIRLETENMLADFSKNQKVVLDAANLYAAVYAADLLNLPMPDYKNGVIQRSVPFYQLVVQGVAAYSSKPLNDYGLDARKEFLKCVETGANPYYIWIYQDNSQLKGTEFGRYYSVHYETWIEQAVAQSNQLAAALAPAGGSVMLRHREVSSGVFCSEYANGAAVYVNYNDTPVEAEGVLIQPMDFAVKGGA